MNSLEFRNIEFAYTEEQGVVLQGIDKKLKRGESVAICLFNLTIRENLLFGKSDAAKTEMEDACRSANVLAFIQGLPQGFEIVIGENGITSVAKCSRCFKLG